MRIKVLAALAAAAALIPSPALAWGKTGHRVVAAIADTQLSGLARAHIREILGGAESLDEAANWPDEMRSAPGSRANGRAGRGTVQRLDLALLVRRQDQHRVRRAEVEADDVAHLGDELRVDAELEGPG